MKFELPKLPYSLDALQPYMDKRTLEFHYGKHHQAYINKLNALVQDTEFKDASLEEIIKYGTGGLFNNAAQTWNHTFYFNGMSPNGGKAPDGELLKVLEKSFGSLENFKNEFSNAAATLFGSGWVWLVTKNDNTLEIIQEGNAGNPIKDGFKPILTLDVWEHAYYLDYQNKRPDYIEAFWNVIDWKKIADRLSI